jgi:hypothetical protein
MNRRNERNDLGRVRFRVQSDRRQKEALPQGAVDRRATRDASRACDERAKVICQWTADTSWNRARH